MNGADFRAVLDGILAREGARWTEADRDRAAVVAQDATLLGIRAAMGVPIDREALHVRAAMAQIAATAELQAATVVREVVSTAIGLVFDRVLGPPNR